MTDITYRPATLADERDLDRVLLAAMSDSMQRTGRQAHRVELTDEEREAGWRRVQPIRTYLHHAGVTWVAEAAGEIVGYARVARWPPLAELTEAMVLPGFQDAGLGTALLERCFGGRTVPDGELRVVRANLTPQAVGLYTRFGTAPILMDVAIRIEPNDIPTAQAAAQAILAHSGLTARTLAVSDIEAVCAIEAAAIGAARPSFHRFLLERPETRALALTDDVGLAGYVYVGSAIGPGAARTPELLTAVMAAAIVHWQGRDSVDAIEAQAPSIAVAGYQWLFGVKGRVTGFSGLCLSRPVPTFDRYLLANPAYTV